MVDLSESLCGLGIWLQSQKLGVQFSTVPPVSRTSLCSFRQAAWSRGTPPPKEGNGKLLLLYLEKPEIVIVSQKWFDGTWLLLFLSWDWMGDVTYCQFRECGVHFEERKLRERMPPPIMKKFPPVPFLSLTQINWNQKVWVDSYVGKLEIESKLA